MIANVTKEPCPRDDRLIVFASLGGFTCSICAPASASKEQVEAFALAELGVPLHGAWVAVDKSKIGLGDASPNACNQVAGRKHWFLLDSFNAARLGLGDTLH